MSSSAPGRDADPLALAERAHALVQVSPRRAEALAGRAVAAARDCGDAGAEVAALHALGWAQMVLGDQRRSVRTMQNGIRVAERAGNRAGAGRLRRVLAVSLGDAGKTRAAQREIDAAIASLSGPDAVRSQVHRVAIHRAAHAVDPAVHRNVCADAARALRILRSERDEIWEARLLFNLGHLHLDRGELDLAEDELRRAERLYARTGAEAAATNAAVMLAELSLLRGDVLGCLTALARVEAAGPEYEHNLLNLIECRVMALTQAQLLPEARAAGEEYVRLCLRAGRRDIAAAAMRSLGGIALAAGDPAEARRLAAAAARSYAARGKLVNAALARTAYLQSRLAEGAVSRSCVRTGLAAARVLETAGWRRDALRTRLLVARVAIAAGSPLVARRELELARPLAAVGTVADRVELCHTRALLLLLAGERLPALRLLRRGLRLLDDYGAALGAFELRAAATRIGVELSQLGLRVAVESGRPAEILPWAERARASSLRLPPVRPPADAALRGLQVELRRVDKRIRVAEERGEPAQGAAARRAELEASIRTRARLIRGRLDPALALPGPAQAARALGERALVEYVALDGRLSALTLCAGRPALHDLGPNETAADLDWLRFALGRLAGGRLSAAERAAARAGIDASAGALEARLIEPLLPGLGARPLVLVPTGPLYALPWGTLPSLRGRPLVVAPSLSVWVELAGRRGSRRRRTALVAGPRLRHSAAEVRELAALHPGATVLHGRAATVDAALAALDGAALGHLACHGRFRSDSPLFSSLELADGPLNVYELQRLRRPPETIVLSACDLGVSSLHPGDELLGVASALLAMGTRTIVASVVPVPDSAARRLMLAVHRELAAGSAPAVALARAQARGAGAGFVCIGRG